MKRGLILALLLLIPTAVLARFSGGTFMSPSPPATPSGWWVSEESTDTNNYGTTRLRFNGTTDAMWVHANGDWIDAAGTKQGIVSYAGTFNSTNSGAPETWNLTITQAVTEAVASTNKQLEVIVTATAARLIADRNTGTPPSVLVTYTDTSTDTLACLDNVQIDGSSSPDKLGPFNLTTPTAFHFAMPNAGKTVSTAVMTLTNTQQFGGTASIFVGKVDEPLYPNGIDGLGVHQGVAASYSKDVGLGADPSIIFFCSGEVASDCFTPNNLDGTNVTSYDYGPSPDTTKLPWVGANKFVPGTDSSYGIVTQTGTTHTTAVITGIASTTGIGKGFYVYDPTGVIPLDAKVLSVDSGTQVTLTAAATSSTTLSLQFVSATNFVTQTGNFANGSAVVTGLSNTALLTVGWRAISMIGANGNAGAMIDSIDSPTQVTLHTTSGVTQSGVSIAFVEATGPPTSSGTIPLVVPSTYTGHGYTPSSNPTGKALMSRFTPGMETVNDYELYFKPTTDGKQSSTYVPGVDATGQGVTIRKTSNLLMDGSTSGFSCTSGSATITVHDPTHGASTGDWVRLPFQVAVCGVILHDWYPITVTDANHYTIQSTGVWWYNYQTGSQATATGNVTDGGAVASFATTLGQDTVVVTLANHAQLPTHFDEFYTSGPDLSVGGMTITGNSYAYSFLSNCAGSMAMTTNTFVINPVCDFSSATATSTATASFNSGHAQVQYETVGQKPWPQGKLPNDLYVRYEFQLGTDFILPANTICAGGKGPIGLAHRTSIMSNGGACAACGPQLKGENHYGGQGGHSERGAQAMGIGGGSPEFNRLVTGTYRYDWDHCQGGNEYGAPAALTPGQRYTLEVHTRMNTRDMTGLSVMGTAPQDGLIEAWIDGRTHISASHLQDERRAAMVSGYNGENTGRRRQRVQKHLVEFLQRRGLFHPVRGRILHQQHRSRHELHRSGASVMTERK